MISFSAKIMEKSILTNLPCFIVFNSLEMSHFLYQLKGLMEAYESAVMLWGDTIEDLFWIFCESLVLIKVEN